jgi:hypothetical protein
MDRKTDKDNGLTKHDNGKLRLDLVEPTFLEGMAEVLRWGAKQYGDDNWKKGSNWRRIGASALRHFVKWFRGQDVDEETGINHLYHCAVNLMFLAHFQRKGIGKDDRPKD